MFQPGFIGGRRQPTLTAVGSDTNGSTVSSITFTGLSFGAADAERVIIAAVGFVRSASFLDSVTIGGVAATEIVAVDNGTHAEIWVASVPIGATGDVALVFSGNNPTGQGVQLYRATSISLTATDTETASGSSAGLTDTIDVPANGIAVAVFCDTNANRPALTWTGLTEHANNDQQMTAAQTIGSAGDFFTAAQSGLSVTCTGNGSPNTPIPSMAIASFGMG